MWRRPLIIKQRNIIGTKPCFKVIDEIEGYDIDTPLDFYVAEQLYIKMFINKKDILAEEE